VKKIIDDRGFSTAVEVLTANNEIPPANFRVLDWKQLEESGAEYTKNVFSEYGAELVEPTGDASTGAVRTLVNAGAIAGAIAPQDQSSLIAVSLLAGSEGKILELCCGRGNKSAVLRESIGSSGKLFCADLSPSKVLTLRRSAKFLSLACDASIALPFKEKFDSIFIDLPCTNLGAIRHHPEIRYNRQPGDVEKAVLLQSKILSNVADFVKPGGRLLYAVCSTEPEEGRDVVERFLAESGSFEAVDIGKERTDLADAGLIENGYLSILPGRRGMDGMFAALLRRKG
jgi:16S rRNA (cytosine967-C5)-methyltransferase